jgi:hypothetical protein
MRNITMSRATLVIFLIAALLLAGLAYDRGKKCGAWESVYAGAKTKQALRAKPLGCWRVH